MKDDMNKKFDLQTLENVYIHLADEKSKEIFKNMLLYNITKERKYIFEFISEFFKVHFLIAIFDYMVYNKINKSASSFIDKLCKRCYNLMRWNEVSTLDAL